MGSLHEANPSIWVATTPTTSYPQLEGDLDVDAAVVGAGITGLSAAIMLLRAGLSVAVIEAGRVASGVTGYTTAKLSSLHGLTYASILDQHGRENAQRYAEASQAAIEKVAEFVVRDGVECDFERMPAFTYSEDENRIRDIEREVEVAGSIGLPATLVTETDLPYPVAAAVRFDDQAVFHPRKYCLGLAELIVREGGQVFEKSRAFRIQSGKRCLVHTEAATVRALHVIQATQLPIHDPAGFFARTSPSRSYALAVTTKEHVPEGMYLSADSPTRSIRPHREDGETYVLLGGEGHKVGQDPDTRERYAALEAWAKETFRPTEIKFRWSAQDYTPVDGLPYIGRLAPGTNGLWVATGFKKWGMTTGTAAGMILADLILERDNPWAETFDSLRLKPGASAKKLLKENVNAAKRFVSDRLHKASAPSAETLLNGQGGIVQMDGRRAAAYRDENGNVTAVSPICTHLRCVVSFNTAEQTWDCPCHGSRFDVEGRVIQGPATKDLKRV